MSAFQSETGQFGFEALLHSAEADNRARRIERETAHLPGAMAEAIPYFRVLLRQHHAAMIAGNIDETMRLRSEAQKLALKLNGGEPGILAGPEAPGCTLERETAAAPGKAPLWGQVGSFLIEHDGMQVRIEIDGVFGIGARCGYWPGFSTHAVAYDRPFLSETGYRSFLGIHAEAEAGVTPDEFVRRVVSGYVRQALKGRLVPIEERYWKATA